MSDDSVTVVLSDGRRLEFDAVLRLPNGWLRCVTDDPSSRMGLPETTTYFHSSDVDRVIR